MRVSGIPDDYEIARVGTPEVGEWFVTATNTVECATAEDVAFIADSYPVAIVTRRMNWHKARRDRHTPPMEARFRDFAGYAWNPGTLVGYAYGTHKYKDQNGRYWRLCEIYY